MFALPGILILVFLIYLRPQEFFEGLQAIPFLYVCLGLTLFGVALDARLRLTKLSPAPQLRWVIAFYAWFLATVARHNAAALVSEAIGFAIAITLYLLLAHGIQTFRGLQAVAVTLLGACLFVALVGAHQHYQPKQCLVIDTGSWHDVTASSADGRSCEAPRDCYGEAAEPGAEYLCENVGILGTTSIGDGRVRYRGVLQDPNDLALAVSISIPVALALRERKRTLLRTLLVLATLLVVGACTVFSQSRGGQLVFLTVLGAYFVKRYGVKGAVLGAVFALPILMLGGRSGTEAEGSANERIECWFEGMMMFRGDPIFGVGGGMFTDHHYLTAHNAYILALAETGFPGFFLWATVLYISIKTPILALRRTAGDPDAQVAQTWAMALLALCIGLYVGIFFLSFTYHYVLWINLGLCGAFYSAMRWHDPEFEVRFGWNDFLLVLAGTSTLTVFLFLYTRYKV